MKASFILALLPALVMALPQGQDNNQPAQPGIDQPIEDQPANGGSPNDQPTQTTYAPCASGQPKCCALGPDGQPDRDCVSPPSTPGSMDDFANVCAGLGQQPICCTSLPAGGQASGCVAPRG